MAKNHFNLFKGYRAEKLQVVKDYDLIKPILDHIFIVLSKSRPDVYNFIMQWFAQIIGDMVPPLIMPEGQNLPQHYAMNGQVPNHPPESYPPTYNPNILHGGTIPPMHLSGPLRMPEDGIWRPMA